MRLTVIRLIAVLFMVLPGCGGGSGDSDAVVTQEQLDALLGDTYERINADTLDLLPGRFEVAFGDLPEILERGVIRVLVSMSQTNYFLPAGFERGFEFELLREYEKTIRGRAGGRLIMVFLPVPFELLLPALAAGRGDIAAAGITVTPDREARVAFSDPYITDVREVVVGHGSSAPVTARTDLSGKVVHVVRGSSYARSLVDLNEELRDSGLDPAVVTRAPSYLEAEDLLELVNEDLIEYTVVDEHIAELWASVLDDIVIYSDSPVRRGGRIAWAVRKDDTELRESLSAFARTRGQGSALGNILFQRYFDDTKWITGSAGLEPERLDEMRGLAQEHAEQHGFDWLLIAAVAHQESRLRQELTSGAGAVGVFQIKPETAGDVGVDDVNEMEGNIVAGIRYLARLRDTYLDDPDLGEVERTDLMLASYNAGPGRIRQLRQLADENGYDGNVWFGNVEYFAPGETRTYVANINRLYYAFRLGTVARETRDEEMRIVR